MAYYMLYMVDVIQVPSAPEIPIIVYGLVAWLVSMVTSLTFMIVYMFRKEKQGAFGGSSTMDTMMLIALVSGKYDMFQKLLSYQLVGSKGDIRKKMLEVVSSNPAMIPNMGMNLDDGIINKEFLQGSVENIKREVIDDLKKELTEEIKNSIKSEIRKNLRSKHKIKV